MNLKNRFKRFWTLDVHNHEGFTLVELIIVIAILAILSTGAIAGYSAYIESANKTTDKALIAELENVLLMAGYSGSFVEGDSGYLILTTDGVKDYENNANLMKVLNDAYGSNWSSALKLNYGSWGNNGLLATLSKEQAQAVQNSSFYKISDDLMSHVELVIGAVGEIEDVDESGLLDLFDEGELNGAAAMFYGEGKDISDVPADELPNLLVIVAANEVKKKVQADGEGGSSATDILYNYAMYHAFASEHTGENAAFDAAYENFVGVLNGSEGTTDYTKLANAYRDLRNAANAADAFATYQNGQGKTDVAAFGAMMGGMSNVAILNPESVKEGFGQKDFYTNGLGNDLFQSYLDTVDTTAGMTDDAFDALNSVAEEGGVALFFSVKNGMINVGNTLPLG